MFCHFRTLMCGALLLILGLLVGGCSAGNLQTAAHDGGPLMLLGNLYQQATQKTGQPPAKPEDLVPYLPAGKSIDELLKSPTDGQPYVILWGTDPRTGMELKPLVIGYEKQGKSGARFVFTAMGVSLMSDNDFKQANFPPGHKPT